MNRRLWPLILLVPVTMNANLSKGYGPYRCSNACIMRSVYWKLTSDSLR